MITKEQIETLAKEHQIDGFTIMREYLQLLFLSYLYQNKEAGKIYFKGGTAIRLLFGSPRFSEDLDFSTLYNKEQLKQIIKKLEKLIQKELPGLRILLLYSGKSGIRFRIKYQPPDFKYPLGLRLDFTEVKKTGQITVSPLLTEFPIAIFPLVTHLSGKDILAEKVNAIANRDKGRDIFDIWYLLEKGITLEKNSNTKILIKKITNFSQKKLDLDLAQFLPKSQRGITEMLKEKLIGKFSSVGGTFGRGQ